MRIKAWAAAFYRAVSKKEPLRQRGSRQVNVWPGEDPAHEPWCSLQVEACVLPPLASEQPLAGSALGKKVEPVSHSPDSGRMPSPTLLVLFLSVRLITVTPEIPEGQALCMACLSPFLGWPSALLRALDQSGLSIPATPWAGFLWPLPPAAPAFPP